MKYKTILFASIILFLISGGTGCDNNNNDDDDICTFNVDDPINDLEWLKNKIPTTTSPDFSVYFDLYQNEKNKQKYFFVEGNINHIVAAYSCEIVYNCKGDTLMFKGIEGPSPAGWDKFFEENDLVKQIWPNK